MLPRDLHIEQINRFHDKLDELNAAFQKETDQQIKRDLAVKIFDLHQIWIEFDNLVEMKVKQALDELEYDKNS